MDGRNTDHRLLAGFLAGDLGPAETRRWDEHLLACEQCWRAVREDRAGRQAAALLRQPAPAGLADRVEFAVEVAAAGGTAALLRAGHEPGGVPAAVAAVARYAQAIPPPAREPHLHPGRGAAPVEVGRPVM